MQQKSKALRMEKTQKARAKRANLKEYKEARWERKLKSMKVSK